MSHTQKIMKIRLGTLSDTKKISLTHRASIRELCKNHYGQESITQWTNILVPDIYEAAIKEKVLIVAEEKNNILGFGILDINNAQLCAIYIHPDHTGKGIAKKILFKLEAIASDKNINQLSLGSTVNALGFYKHYGYIEDGKTFHTLPNGIKLKCIKMHKILKK